eukprot:452682-Pelagomonas_calceolata.AAC.2
MGWGRGKQGEGLTRRRRRVHGECVRGAERMLGKTDEGFALGWGRSECGKGLRRVHRMGRGWSGVLGIWLRQKRVWLCGACLGSWARGLSVTPPTGNYVLREHVQTQGLPVVKAPAAGDGGGKRWVGSGDGGAESALPAPSCAAGCDSKRTEGGWLARQRRQLLQGLLSSHGFQAAHVVGQESKQVQARCAAELRQRV